MAPRVSVVIPTRNRLRQLQQAVASVEAQSFRDIEVLVIDDGSSDGTLDWLAGRTLPIRALSTLPAVGGPPHREDRDTESKARHHSIATSPSGASAARNVGIQQARGEFIAFLDDDDLWKPDYLKAQIDALATSPGAALSYAEYVELHPSGRATLPDTRALMEYDTLMIRMLAEAFIHTMSVVVCRKSVFDRLGLFDEHLHIVHDWEWYTRLLSSGEEFAHIDRLLVGHAVPGGLVTRHRDWFDEERRVIDARLTATNSTLTQRRLVRSYRSLFFANLALSRGDVAFGLMRLADSFGTSPISALSIASRRILRRMHIGTSHAHALEPWDATASATR